MKRSQRSWSTARSRPSALLAALRESDTSGAVLAAGITANHGRLPDVGEAVLPHVRSGRPGMTGLLDALVGAAVRVEGLDQAVEAALSHPDALIVTPAGDRFAPTGWRVGAAAGGADRCRVGDARLSRPPSRPRSRWPPPKQHSVPPATPRRRPAKRRSR